MSSTAKLGGVLALALALAVPSSAGAAINIYSNSPEATQLGAVTKLKCRTPSKGKRFIATGRTTNGAYNFAVDILSFDGFGPEYQVPFGVMNPTVDVEGVNTPEDYSNNYPFPGTPPPSSGAIAFRKKGKQLRIGIYALPNQDYSAGVALAGGAKCDYPNKKKKKK